MVWMKNISFSIYYKEINMKQKRLQRTMIGGLFWLTIGLTPCFGHGNSQDSERDNAQWVNPFIGTALSDVPTLWGDYGGTYPGAVAPWGLVQLSPETSARPSQLGYYYHDTKILWFTCLDHNSGYPNGSTGRLNLVLMRGKHSPLPQNYDGRSFSHSHEHSEAGYYKVQFEDGDEVEMTAASHAGLLRYHTASDTTTLAIFNAGHINVADGVVRCEYGHSIFSFSHPFEDYTMRGDTLYAHFVRATPLQISLTTSTNSFKKSQENGEKQLSNANFEAVRTATYEAWRKELSCVDMNGATDDVRTKFYTALYHAMLCPTNVADVGETPTFRSFSFWDTFRTLHPLLSMLKPEMQKNMVDGAMAEYRRWGKLPKGPMTGIHAIPVLLDSYVKGATRCSLQEIYEACRKTYDAWSGEVEMQQYLQQGFVDAQQEASVSITAELAYDDWAMMAICRMLGHEDEASLHAQRALNYTNLWDTRSLLMLPRHGRELLRDAGELGYQESTKYTASFFAPHNNEHIVNLSGGANAFARRLDEAFEDGRVAFDNETVLNYPYLFVWARRPDLTLKHVHQIVTTNYGNTPGGIPGNDDLGSMSSWLAFAMMGVMPACPGSDEYIVLPPFAEEVILHLPNGNDLHITGGGTDRVDAMPQPSFNGSLLQRCHLTHEELMKGGTLRFDDKSQPDFQTMLLPYSLVKDTSRFELTTTAKAEKKVTPHQACFLPITVTNRGADGVCVATLLCDGKAVASSHVRVSQNETVTDTIHYRLYAEGPHVLSLGDNWQQKVMVVEAGADARRLQCCGIEVKPVVKQGEPAQIKIQLKNIGGKPFCDKVAMLVDDVNLSEINSQLEPGETAVYEVQLPVLSSGVHRIQVADGETKVKVYDNALTATVLDVDFVNGKAVDNSGFTNDGTGYGALTWSNNSVTTAHNAYVEFPKTASLMYGFTQLTMLTWVRPSESGDDYIDFFTKGDKTVLKINGGRSLTFFAGGWGRGECEVPVPEKWYNHWHLVAGVCESGLIKIYVDGRLKQTLSVKGDVKASELPWNLGRNAEMPYARFGNNEFRGTRIYAAPLSDEQILQLYTEEFSHLQAE